MSGKPAGDNLVRFTGAVGPEDRRRLLGHAGCVVWLTGLSGSGKSTIAHGLEERLLRAGHLAYVLDGDNVRHGLDADVAFSPEQRDENIRRLGEVAALFADAGVITITAFISPYRAGRQRARDAAGRRPFVEVFLDVPVEECEKRDPKGLYCKARSGQISDFTGLSAPYEPPAEPELVLQTGRLSVQQCVEAVEGRLRELGVLPRQSNGNTGPGRSQT